MIGGALVPQLSGQTAAAPLPRGGGGMSPGMPGRAQTGDMTKDDLSTLPLPQLIQLTDTATNPAVKAAGMTEIARRGAQPDQPEGLSAVSSGAVDAPGQLAPVQPDQPPRNPALDSIATGTMAANATAAATPDQASQSFPISPDAASGQNPALVAAQQAAPSNGLSSIGDLMKGIQTTVSPEDKMLALSKGFFTMASSRQPGFLGALGEGGNAATDALQSARDRAMKNQMFGVDVTQKQQGIDEGARSNRVQEGQGASRIDIARQQLGQAQDAFNFEKQKYAQGLGTDTALKLAQIAATRAQANYSAIAAEVARAGEGQIIQTDQGLQRISGATATPIVGTDKKPLNQQYIGGGTALEKNVSFFQQNIPGLSFEDALSMANTGKSMSPDQRYKAAQDLANKWAVANTGLNGTPPPADRIAAKAQEFLEGLGGAGAAAPGPAAPQAPAAAAGATPPIPESIKSRAGLQWSQTRQQFRDPSTGETFDASGKKVP